MKKNSIVLKVNSKLGLFEFKNQTKSLLGVLLFWVLSLALTGCEENKSSGNSFSVDETKIADVIQNLSNGNVTPGYVSFDSNLQTLSSKLTALSAAPEGVDSLMLAEAREAFRTAYLSWVKISSFQFGAASTQDLNVSLNFFSINLVIVESNLTKILAGEEVDLNNVSQRSARGFTALDFLLYSEGTFENQLALLNEDSGYKEYIAMVNAHMKSVFGAVYDNWNKEGKTAFEAAGGVASGSSMAVFVNEFNVDFEANSKTKRLKSALGLPATLVKPTEVEAFYSKLSKELLAEHIASLSDIYEGKSFAGIDGYGLADYLEESGAKVEVGGTSVLLSSAISDQFSKIKTAIEAIPTSIDQAVVSDYATVKLAYDEMQKMVILTKVEMPSVLGVQITYIDNDGD